MSTVANDRIIALCVRSVPAGGKSKGRYFGICRFSIDRVPRQGHLSTVQRSSDRSTAVVQLIIILLRRFFLYAFTYISFYRIQIIHSFRTVLGRNLPRTSRTGSCKHNIILYTPSVRTLWPPAIKTAQCEVAE